MKKVKTSIVSYMNTIPLVYGIENNVELQPQISLSKDIPSECAKKLLNGDIDLGLVPVAIIPKLKEAHIISDFCIGANGKVKSVLLLSDEPIEKVEQIYLDYQSRTSVNLCRILCKEHWKVSPEFLDTQQGFESKIEGNTAGVIIGDRTFHLNKEYKYQYDLAEEWQKMTDLPFVFAAWVSNKKLPEPFLQQFNIALKEGLNNLDSSIDSHPKPIVSKEELREYLTYYIKFELTTKKREALDLYLSKLQF